MNAFCAWLLTQGVIDEPLRLRPQNLHGRLLRLHDQSAILLSSNCSSAEYPREAIPGDIVSGIVVLGRPASVPDERDARCTQILHYFLNAYSLISPLALFHAIDVNGNLHLGMVKRDDVHLVVEHR